ncbi:glycosyltransferase [Conexibacter woesei]|uniref:Glycosyl transferase group 1 n=1 Tax=Conexibacter woesei (strain DSM 14684 / CCUG 47730 / CIP 108061 / JCM 11494 / NBRC 100937 / ID131577) TaxID=469383 RepID=D3F2B4_CONWI|nr:glycosyltransferase [Conexibacter woesei]ADB50289.1 glycosyl transferase group 1 [Conexibacter woesei DSM 14684]
MRALVVTNMYPSPARPALGRFVHDQVEALRRIEGVEVELFAFPPGLRSYPRAARELRRRFRDERFDVVHAHFGLTAWPALAVRGAPHVVTFHGTDLAHPRSGRLSRAVVPLMSLAATVSASLASLLPGAGTSRRVAVLPCGVDLTRFRPLPRAEARARLGLDPRGRFLLFPAAAARSEKRVDRAREIAGDATLLTLENVPPDDVPLWVNAANAVLIPSEREGFGLAVLEALACDVPVLATPVGIAPLALEGIAGAHCAPFDAAGWRAALAPHLAEDDPRIAGRARAGLFSADRMARRVAVSWQALATEAARAEGGRGYTRRLGAAPVARRGTH